MSSRFVENHEYEVGQVLGSPSIESTSLRFLFFHYYFFEPFRIFSKFFGIFSYLKIQKNQSQQDQGWFDLVNRSTVDDRVKGQPG